ncbi:MAG: polyribonucleotide nucleotidyltransferase [Alphaproteobacteria bacterium]|nr:polyribonucleotide nucleotidyltransferase [Alphaproteobacteria bacterium]
MHGVNERSVTVEIGGATITFSTGKYAKQAGAAVVASSGESSVLCTLVCTSEPTRFDFMPLTVDYQDRDGSRGAIPGGFLKREGRGNERTTLISRLIDRPIRPLFPKNFRCETQLIATVMSFDPDHETDVLALCGCAAAVHVSDAPTREAIAGVRICQVDGELVINPGFEGRAKATLNIVVAGTRDAIIMVEGGAHEVSEDLMLDAFDLAHDAIRKLIDAMNQLNEQVGIANREVEAAVELPADIVASVEAYAGALAEAQATASKHERKDNINNLKRQAIAELTSSIEDEAAAAEAATNVVAAFDKLAKRLMRTRVIQDAVRIDGRAPDEIRDIWCEVGVATRAHGSAVFTRGETQGLVLAALGTERDNQRIDWAGAYDSIRNWMLTYVFPPFCTGEARPLRAPKRREVGHGALAHRALEPVLPTFEDFPYVLRCSADILESNGSSSMATVCGATLSLMDAGVPIKAPVAGIAMGLVKEGDDFAVLSDILGDEDHLGDMDFKVTGTRDGITAFQMDCKIAGVSREIMARALNQARDGRLHILDEMGKSLAAPREELSPYAPRITTIKIKVDKIRDIIGPGGKVIRGIQDKTGTTVNVDDTGRVQIAATSQEAADKAVGMIRELTQEAEIGKLYMGVVKRVVDFGAFVEIFPGTDGLIHISHLAKERVGKVTDVVNEGDEVLVRVIDVDKSGKIRLSRKEALDVAMG